MISRSKVIIIVFLIVFIGISLVVQGYNLYRFVSAGNRFTGDNGDSLCSRIVVLEEAHGIFSEEKCEFGKIGRK